MAGTNNDSIGNFTVENVCAIDAVYESGTIPSVGFNIKLENGETSKEIVVPLNGPKGLGHIDLYSLHPHIIVSQKNSTARQNFATLTLIQTSVNVKRLLK